MTARGEVWLCALDERAQGDRLVLQACVSALSLSYGDSRYMAGRWAKHLRRDGGMLVIHQLALIRDERTCGSACASCHVVPVADGPSCSTHRRARVACKLGSRAQR